MELFYLRAGWRADLERFENLQGLAKIISKEMAVNFLKNVPALRRGVLCPL